MMQYGDGFGTILRELRGQKGLSQQQLADAVAVSRAAIAMYESGKRLPDILLIPRLAECLGVDSRVLFDAMRDAPDEAVNILVVDDVPALLQGGVGMMRSVAPSANIVGFEGGAEALAYARENRVSIAFLDIEIDEEMDGLELARRLRELDPHTNIIFLTNYTEYMAQATYDHCSGYILKPLTRERIRHELENLRFPVRGLGL